MLNTIFLSGRLVKPAEIKTLPSGLELCSFTLAHNTKKDTAMFIDCVGFGSVGKAIYSHTQKGDLVLVSGELNQNEYTDKEGNKRRSFNISVKECQFLNGKNDKPQTESKAEPNNPAPSVKPIESAELQSSEQPTIETPDVKIPDDEIPF